MIMADLLSLFLIVLLVSLAVAALSFAPWVPVPKKELRRILGLAELKTGEVFYDLGCGDGRVVFAAAEIPGVQAVGIELALPMYLVCRIKQVVWPEARRAKIRLANFFRVDLQHADVIYLFGVPRTLRTRLTNKLKAECKPGTRVLSYAFPVDGWSSMAEDVHPQSGVTIYRYVL